MGLNKLSCSYRLLGNWSKIQTNVQDNWSCVQGHPYPFFFSKGLFHKWYSHHRQSRGGIIPPLTLIKDKEWIKKTTVTVQWFLSSENPISAPTVKTLWSIWEIVHNPGHLGVIKMHRSWPPPEKDWLWSLYSDAEIPNPNKHNRNIKIHFFLLVKNISASYLHTSNVQMFWLKVSPQMSTIGCSRNVVIEAFTFIFEHSITVGGFTQLRHPGQTQGYIKGLLENRFTDWHILLALLSGAALCAATWCGLFFNLPGRYSISLRREISVNSFWLFWLLFLMSLDTKFFCRPFIPFFFM